MIIDCHKVNSEILKRAESMKEFAKGEKTFNFGEWRKYFLQQNINKVRG